MLIGQFYTPDVDRWIFKLIYMHKLYDFKSKIVRVTAVLDLKRNLIYKKTKVVIHITTYAKSNIYIYNI